MDYRRINLLIIGALVLFFTVIIQPSASILEGVSSDENISNRKELVGILKNTKLPWAQRKEAAIKLRYERGSFVVGWIVKALKSKNSKTRVLAAYALGGKDETGKQTAEELLKYLIKDKAADVRIAAVMAAGNLARKKDVFKLNEWGPWGVKPGSIVDASESSYISYTSKAMMLAVEQNDADPEVKKIATETLKALKEYNPTPLDNLLISYDQSNFINQGSRRQ